MATEKSSAPHAHPSIEEQDDAVETHYSGLERLRPHACNDGWVTIGQLVVDPETGEETEEYALYLCRCCVDSPDPKRGDRERVDAQAAYALMHLRGEP